MAREVDLFIRGKQNLLQYFQCEQDYFVKPLLDCKWQVQCIEDVHFLSYWAESGRVNRCVVVQRGTKPLCTTRGEYTMVVAIDCIKIAFLLKNSNKQGNLHTEGKTDVPERSPKPTKPRGTR